MCLVLYIHGRGIAWRDLEITESGNSFGFIRYLGFGGVPRWESGYGIEFSVARVVVMAKELILV